MHPFRPLTYFDLNLIEDGLGRPGGIGHAVLQTLAVIVEIDYPPSDIGIVAVGFHRQYASQIVIGVLAGVASFGPEAEAEARPNAPQTLSEFFYSFEWQSPALGIKYIGFIGCLNHRGLPTSIPLYGWANNTTNWPQVKQKSLLNLTLSKY